MDFPLPERLQGLNRGLVPMLSGVVEMVCRIIVIAVTLNPFGYWAVRLASPITWLFTGILLIVTYFIWENRAGKTCRFTGLKF